VNESQLTVLMTVHNCRLYISKAVQSILSQTFEDFEFLIIDDASTDDSIEIIKGFNDPRIRLIRNEENIGLTRSLNLGISLANAQYIARMDSDDISMPTRLQKQINFLKKNPSYGLVGTRFRYIDEQGHQVLESHLPSTNQEIKKKLYDSNQFAHSSVMFTIQSIQTVGSYKNFFIYAQDYDLFLRISEKYDVYNIPEVLVEWRIRLNSASVKYRTLQDRYAHVARMCSLERRKTGTDPIEKKDFRVNEISALKKLTSTHFSTRCKKKNIMANSYYYWANFFHRKRKIYPQGIRYTFRLLIKSFLANPFIFLLLICKRLISSLKWRLKINTLIL